MRSSKSTGFQASYKITSLTHSFLVKIWSPPLPAFSQNPSLLRRNPRKISDALRINLSESRLSVTNCFFLPHFTLERGQLARGCGRQWGAGKEATRQECVLQQHWVGKPGNSSRMYYVSKLGWGTWQLFRRREPPLSSCHEHWGRGWNSAGSFTLCFFGKFEMGTEGTYSCSCKEKENYFFKKV